MSISVSIGGGGGGFSTATLETTTGDSETKLQEISLPSEDGVYAVKAYASVTKKGAADNYAAFERFMKSFRVSGGSIVETVDHSNEESFQDLVSGLFSSGDIDLKSDGSGNVGVYGTSPEDTETASSSDISGVSGLPSSFNDGAVASDNSGNLYLSFRDSDQSQITFLPLGGSKSQVSNESLRSGGVHHVELVIDSAGNAHVVWVNSSENLKYSTNSSGSFSEPETIVTGSVTGPSLDVDENDVPHVAFYDSTTGYANREGGSWSSQSDVSNGSIGNRVDLYVKSSSEIVISFRTGSSLGVSIGTLNNFTTDTSVYPNDVPVSSIDERSSGDYLIGFVDDDNNKVVAGVGDLSSGFTFTDVASPSDLSIQSTEALIAYSGNNDNILFRDDSSDSDPFDAIHYVDNGGWSRKKVLATLGDEWVSSRQSNRIALSDLGSGDKEAYSIVLEKSLNATLKWRTGAEVLNADA